MTNLMSKEHIFKWLDSLLYYTQCLFMSSRARHKNRKKTFDKLFETFSNKYLIQYF